MDLRAEREIAKRRLTEAAARLLAGDRSAAAEADQATAEIRRIRETGFQGSEGKHTIARRRT